MFNWKIALTAAIVLGVLAFFVGTSPAVSGFFAVAGEKLGELGYRIGIDWGEKGEANFTLYLDDFGKVGFDAIDSDLYVKGDIEAAIDRGKLYFTDLSVSSFTGDGTISKEKLEIAGTASQVSSGKSQLSISHISISSIPAEFFLPRARISIIYLGNTSGSIALSGSTAQFSGELGIDKFSGTLDLVGGRLILDGSAKAVTIPSAGIRIGKA
jgi:hypothetical protein